MNFTRTLDNPKWMAKHAEAIRVVFPHHWSCPCSIRENADFIAEKMRLIGINLRDGDDMTRFTFRLLQIGILEFRGGKKDGMFRVKPVDGEEVVITA